MAIEVTVCRGAGVAMPNAPAKCGRENLTTLSVRSEQPNKQLADTPHFVQREPVLYAVCTRNPDLTLSEEGMYSQSTTRVPTTHDDPTSHVSGEEVAEPPHHGGSGSVNLIISSEQIQKADGGTYLSFGSTWRCPTSRCKGRKTLSF